MATAQARLSLDGASLPIVARIERSTDEVLVVGRRLPFLRIGTRVEDESGKKGAISRVSLAVEEGVPYLSVELEYDVAQKSAPPRERRDATLGYEMRPSRPPSISPPSMSSPSTSGARLDDTNHDSTLDLAMSVTATHPLPETFVPSLHPMPLPIPEGTIASSGARRPVFLRRMAGLLAALGALLSAWVASRLG